MENSGEVSLVIDNQIFKVNKDVLCEYSDYFRAMFSGNYIENEKKEISIDVVDANSMNIIIRYMQMGFIDLSELTLSIIGEVAISANFLQITELMKQIEYCLDLQLSPSNWVETLTIAENSSYRKLEELCTAFGLYEFKLMKPEYIQPVHKLVWFLSHTHLNAESELQVFKFGLNWILHNETGADALLLILGCLDMNKITKEDLHEIKVLIKDYENSLAEKVVACLCNLATDFEISITEAKKNKTFLCETYTERVYTEVLNLVGSCVNRNLQFRTCVALWASDNDPDKSPNILPHSLYTLSNGQTVERWLEVTEKNLWGWTVVAWGPTKIVILGGEYGRGTGLFWKDVKVYDTLREEWIEHGVKLPIRRHAGVAVVEDSLYIIGGVGGYRIVLDTAIIYDLKQRTYRKIARFPNALQSPAVCVHENKIYAAGVTNIYRYEDYGESDRWVPVLQTNIRHSCMQSYRGYIYCIQNYMNPLYRFRPDVDQELELITYFSYLPSSLCNLGDRLLAFSHTNDTQSDMVNVEEYKEKSIEGKPKVIWSKKNCNFTINDVAGSCAIIDTIPPLRPEVSSYLKRYLTSYEACYSK